MKKLSKKEMLLVQYAAQGYKAKEIAKKIGLEYKTVEFYMRNIRRKLSAKNMPHVIYLACLNHLLPIIPQY